MEQLLFMAAALATHKQLIEKMEDEIAEYKLALMLSGDEDGDKEVKKAMSEILSTAMIMLVKAKLDGTTPEEQLRSALDQAKEMDDTRKKLEFFKTTAQ
jgi:hypothetical protein